MYKDGGEGRRDGGIVVNVGETVSLVVGDGAIK
jgi:hypothetical protein